MSAERRGGERRTSTPFCPQRATEEHGERQLLFDPRRARRTSTPFCPPRARRNTENGNCFLVRGGRGGARRTSTPFYPPRARRNTQNGNCFLIRGGRGELQRLFVHRGHGGTRRTATAFWSAEDAEGRGELQHLFVHRGPRRNTQNGNCFFDPRRTWRGGTAVLGSRFPVFGELPGTRRTTFCPRRGAEDCFSWSAVGGGGDGVHPLPAEGIFLLIRGGERGSAPAGGRGACCLCGGVGGRRPPMG